jgi:hypothetical protein
LEHCEFSLKTVQKATILAKKEGFYTLADFIKTNAHIPKYDDL